MKKVGISINSQTDSSRKVIQFKDDVKVLYKAEYTGAVTGTYDAIGYLQNGSYRWVHSQIALGMNPEDYDVIVKLALLALNGERIYTLTLDPDGGTVIPTQITGYYEEDVVLPTPTRPGYIFHGWVNEKGELYAGGQEYRIKTTETLTAEWRTIYTITFNAKGGYVYPENITQGRGYMVYLPMPEKMDSEFIGWKNDAGDTYDAGAQYEVTKNEILTARWKYTIFLNPNGGTVDPTKVGPLEEGTQVNLPTPTREGYIFDGWIDNEGNIYKTGDIYTITQPETLEALWIMQLDEIAWEQDVSTSIGSLQLADNGKTVTMKGNKKRPGKNAIWTDTENDIKSIQFDYSINFGDSFNAAGVLLSIKEDETTGYLTGYMISFNKSGRWGSTTNGTGTIWKFTYDKVNTTNITKTFVQKLDINTSGTLKIDMTDGMIQITGGGLTEPAYIYDSNINRKTFGFFSDHYSHDCSNIGQFNLTNIKVIC